MQNNARNRHHLRGFDADSSSDAFEALFQEDIGLDDLFQEEGEGESWDEAIAAFMESDPDWIELQAAGIDHIEVARAAFPEIADADDAEVEDFLFEITANMDDAAFGKFMSGLAKFGKKALRVVAPAIQAAAPTVGTAIGAAFGGVGAPIGGAIGSLLGSGVGALNQAVNAPSGQRAPRRRHRRRRGRRTRLMHRRRRSAGVRTARSFGRTAGQQVMGLLQNPQVQSALLNMAQRGVGAIVGRSGETMSGSAAVAALIGGLESVLREAQEAGQDLDSFDGDFAPEDFGSTQEAFQTLVELLECTP